jgi:hypothetical protein
MLRVIISGTVASVFTGMFGATIGGLIWDTATIPFVFSACSGFVVGAVGFYRDAVRKSLSALDRYPRLLQLHLDANFPHRGFHAWKAERFRSQVFGQTWVLRSMLVASWLTAAGALDVSALYLLGVALRLSQWRPPKEHADSPYYLKQILDAEEEAIIIPYTRILEDQKE